MPSGIEAADSLAALELGDQLGQDWHDQAKTYHVEDDA